MGYGDFGCFNGGISDTPELDRLAAEGITLTQHYSASPVCAPARAALLTGRHPHRTGAIDTLEMRGLDRLALGERTIGDLFAAAGYATGLIGKWHNGALDARYHPNHRGFAEFAGFSGGWAPYVNYHLDRNGTIAKSDDGAYMTDSLTDEAVRFIARHEGDPFVLMLAYSAPHFPFQAPADDFARFAETGAHTTAVSHIYGMIRSMDRGIARVREALAERGLEENTIVLFTSDNGPQFGGAGDMCTDRFNCGFAGAKLSVYEGGIRVPMLLRWPAGLDAPRRIDALVHFSDWLPTLLAAAGIEAPRGISLDGTDVLQLLRGGPPAAPPRRFWQWNRYTPVATCNAAMREGDWKLVRPEIEAAMHLDRADLVMDIDAKYNPARYADILRTPEPARTIGEAPPPQLFNVRDDPLEQHDIAGAERERVARMQQALSAWFEEVDAERRAIRD